MIKILSSETAIIGDWIYMNGKITADATCQRIYELTNSFLVEICRDESGWEALYRDPNDNRFWELTYPQSGLQGGGPPQLRYLTAAQANTKYKR